MTEELGKESEERTETPEPVVRFSRFKSLSSRLLMLTIVCIMLIELFIFAPSVSRFRKVWFEEHLAAAELAALALEVTPDMKVARPLQDRLLAHAGAHGIILRKPGHSVLALSKEMPEEVDVTVDVRPELSFMWLGGAVDTFLQKENRVVRVIGPSTMDEETTVEVILDEAPMRSAMVEYGSRILALSIVISLFTAAFVYLSIQWLMVRPMGRITRSMIAFRRAPEDESSGIVVSDREDEIGVAERELAVMQDRLRTALKEKDRLAALGSAVAKVNHDLRNSLASASLISDKLASSEDPQVREYAPRLVASIDKAVELCSQTLDFVAEKGKQMIKRRFFLFDLIEEAEALSQPLDIKLGEDTGETWTNKVPTDLELMADPDQLVRALSNLARNAFEAGASEITIEASEVEGLLKITLSDNGPGLPKKALENLFRPFEGSAKKGGTGLGLIIVKDIVSAHGGDVRLISSDTRGTVFQMTLPTEVS